MPFSSSTMFFTTENTEDQIPPDSRNDVQYRWMPKVPGTLKLLSDNFSSRVLDIVKFYL